MDRLELIHAFRKKYRSWVRSDLISLKMCANQKTCFLEIRFKEKKRTIIFDLFCISDHTGIEISPNGTINARSLSFSPCNDIVDNANEFLSLDDYSMVNRFDLLFTRQANEEICSEFESNLRV